ncbi:MAG: undecaprenyl diphosphate synthase family protein [Candidatus Peribacteraceae bacterium]
MHDESEFIGIICDGDRTWAKEKYGVASKADLTVDQLRDGYSMGANSVEQLMNTAIGEMRGILAFWGLSDKNMSQRTEMNLRVLFDVFHTFFRNLLENWINKAENKNVRLIHLGKPLGGLPDYTKETANALNDVVASTKTRTGLVIAFCLNYNGDEELANAIRNWSVNKNGTFRDHLYLPQILQQPCPSLDGIIRTGIPTGKALRRGNYLIGYEEYKTAYISSPLPSPEYSPEAFMTDLRTLREGNKKEAGA